MEQFMRNYAPAESGNEEQAYRDYVKRHRRMALERFFSQHKQESWFTERYDPFRSRAFQEKQLAAVAQRLAAFQEDLSKGVFEGISLEDGTDLEMGTSAGSPNGSYLTRSFPASMRLPERLRGGLCVKGSHMIALSNIAPSVSLQKLEETLQVCSGGKLRAVELSEPIAEKGLYRLAWAELEPDCELSTVASSIEERSVPKDPLLISY